jgi:hypothetical protein
MMEWWYQSAEERMSAPTVYPPPPPPPPPKVKKQFSVYLGSPCCVCMCAHAHVLCSAQYYQIEVHGKKKVELN